MGGERHRLRGAADPEVEMKNMSKLLAVAMTWSVVSGLRLSNQVRNGWVLAHSDRDVRL